MRWKSPGSASSVAVAGVVMGVLSSLALSRLIAQQLYGVGASDPLTFIAVPGVLIATAALACYLPARRAARIDAIAALRAE